MGTLRPFRRWAVVGLMLAITESTLAQLSSSEGPLRDQEPAPRHGLGLPPDFDPEETVKSWYVPPLSISTERDKPVPEYAGPLSRYEHPDLQSLDWLDLGLEQRSRYELRDDNYRNALADDHPILMRSRLYLGVREKLDPVRFAVEFQDARQFMNNLTSNDRDVDENELLQAYLELYFKDVFGLGRPLSVQAGRLTIDAIDRRLITRNGFRNTTNAFDGFRVRAGDMDSDWQAELFAVQPVERRLRQFNRSDDERWLYGLTGAWRRWSQSVTLEPYYFILDEDRADRDLGDRELHTVGLRAYGPILETQFDYDANGAVQFGNDNGRKVRAFAGHGEIGYRVNHPWTPRLAWAIDYASGDRVAEDELQERFDPLFGSSHTFYGFSDFFSWQNTINPSFQVSARPHERVRLMAIYRSIWLASDSDAFVRGGLRDTFGDIGDHVGQEIDLLIRLDLSRHVEIELGYAHFMPGDFVKNASWVIDRESDDSDFFYVQTCIRF